MLSLRMRPRAVALSPLLVEFAIVASLFLFLSGCITIPVSPRYQPSSQLEIHPGVPTRIDLEIRDERGDDAFYQGGPGSIPGLYALTLPPQQIIAEGFTEALQSRGYELHKDAEIKYSVTIKRFLARQQFGAKGIDTEIVLDVAVKRGDQILATKTFFERDVEKRGFFQQEQEVIEAVLSRSLSSAVDKAVKDPNLTAAIEGTSVIGSQLAEPPDIQQSLTSTPAVISDTPVPTEKLKVLSESLDETDVTKISDLIGAGADVNVINRYGSTPLHIASQQGHTEIVKLLLAAKADVNAIDKTNNATPLYMASQNGHTEIVRLLLAAKADVNAGRITDGVTPLHIASQQGHTEIVRLLLAAKADVNAKAHVGGKDYTSLSIAKRMGRSSVVKLLQEYGAKE